VDPGAHPLSGGVEGFDRLLRDPDFAEPGSAVAKAAIPLGRLAHREAMTMINLAARLGFSPAARLALGIETRKASPAAADDPWTALRLVPRGLDPAAGDAE
jgi:hypothetical protein